MEQLRKSATYSAIPLNGGYQATQYEHNSYFHWFVACQAAYVMFVPNFECSNKTKLSALAWTWRVPGYWITQYPRHACTRSDYGCLYSLGDQYTKSTRPDYRLRCSTLTNCDPYFWLSKINVGSCRRTTMWLTFPVSLLAHAWSKMKSKNLVQSDAGSPHLHCNHNHVSAFRGCYHPFYSCIRGYTDSHREVQWHHHWKIHRADEGWGWQSWPSIADTASGRWAEDHAWLEYH